MVQNAAFLALKQLTGITNRSVDLYYKNSVEF